MSTETKTCPYCGEEISVNAKKCIHCKEWLEPLSPSQIITPEKHPTEQPVYPRQQEPMPYINDPYQIRQPYYRQSETRQQVIVNQSAHESNGMGTAGFILSLISFVLSWGFVQKPERIGCCRYYHIIHRFDNTYVCGWSNRVNIQLEKI